MRRCGVCQYRLRRDESLSLLEVPGENGVTERVHACAWCVADANGLPAPRPRVYAVGSPPPPVPICGLCRLALYDGARTTTARITQEDVDLVQAMSRDGMDIEPGAYEMCEDCLAVWRPMIAQRLHGDRTRKVAGNALL